ncbi:MarR family transcriptional regulator [Streptomonospora sp. PA3]|uniref:MarR family winged helix-turn-helix transcriptional regulator n=1 Tax=Streptomonospora sp. PA3 TaxID=2607326 RepID=UPI0012DEFB2C|nr:MarR family transcriptional regulator [Streptomonospora sp. PA3]MUL43923.1 MarR family transcriptional regulator [Streptomonospora sp. PA3]
MVSQPDLSADAQLDRDVCKLVHRFTQSLDVQVRRVAEELGITASQVVALRELSEPITARELAARMNCEASNATFVLDRLEQHGLIERRPHPGDRRAKRIVLTGDGMRLRDDVLQRLSAYSSLAPLTPAEQESFRDLLRKLVASQ